MVANKSTTALVAAAAPPVKPGMVLRMSLPASKLVEAVIVPVRKPLPSGLYGTNPIPNSLTGR
jgi:hypothetical protein